MKPKEIFWSGLKGGLFEQKHYLAMGEAIFLFGWLCTRQSQIEEGNGLPHYGNPLTDKQISQDTGFPVRNIRLWRERLIRTGYIHCTRVGNLGLIYFIHKAKSKAKNPKPPTRYFPAELQPNGDYRAAKSVTSVKTADIVDGKVSQQTVTPKAQVSQQTVTTLTANCHTYADKPHISQEDTQNTNTLIPKHLFNYNTQAGISSVFRKAARELQPLGKPSLQERQKLLDVQAKTILDKHNPGWRKATAQA